MSIRTHVAQVLAVTLITALSPIGSLAHADRAVVPVRHFAAPPGGDVEPAPDSTHTLALDRETVLAALVRRRARSLAAFRAYEAAGVFPSNVYQGRPLNVWRDQDGHYCAAATIIFTSGQASLVERVADQDNNIRLADVTTGPLMDWMLTSGLTQEELALIQRPFRPVVTRPVPEPTHRVAIAPDLRTAETVRLAALYTSIDRTLAAHSARSLEVATTRLLQHPSLAWSLIANDQI